MQVEIGYGKGSKTMKRSMLRRQLLCFAHHSRRCDITLRVDTGKDCTVLHSGVKGYTLGEYVVNKKG